MSKLGELESVIKDLTKQQNLILEYYISFINNDSNNTCQNYHKALAYLSSPEINWDIKKIKPNFGERDIKIDYSKLISRFRSVFFKKLIDNNPLSIEAPNTNDYLKAPFNAKLRNSIAKFVYSKQIFNMAWNDFVSQTKEEFEDGYDFSNFYNITIRAYRHCARELGLNENL
jgi:hypothetical protein